jgi:hypothetical protein
MFPSDSARSIWRPCEVATHAPQNVGDGTLSNFAVIKATKNAAAGAPDAHIEPFHGVYLGAFIINCKTNNDVRLAAAAFGAAV